MVKIEIGQCGCCSRRLQVTKQSLRRQMRVPCRCGHANTVDVDDATINTLRHEADVLGQSDPDEEITLRRIA